MRIVKANSTAGKKAIAALIDRGDRQAARVEPVVRKILANVRKRGDSALREYAARFDGLDSAQALRVSLSEMAKALSDLRRDDPDLVRAMETAAQNIRRFSEWQKPQGWNRDLQAGVRVGQMIRPLGSVGCYVPGGRYPLPSTLLMTVIPAQAAGVKRIVVVSPSPAQVTLAAAGLLGVTEFYRVGGAQAIAALAYGSKTIAPVDKIVGPGNSYVTAAKKLCGCAIDMLAGPTEALLVSQSGDPRFIASDLVAQAEHDVETSVAFITASSRLAKKVSTSVKALCANNATAQKAIKANGHIILTRNRKESLEIANAIASEHLTVDAEDVEAVQCAGSLFIGGYSAQSSGDYAAGPNHVLPTGGLARARGGLSVNDFVKIITVQQVSRSGLNNLSPIVIRMAEAEGLEAHAASIAVRTEAARA